MADDASEAAPAFRSRPESRSRTMAAAGATGPTDGPASTGPPPVARAAERQARTGHTAVEQPRALRAPVRDHVLLSVRPRRVEGMGRVISGLTRSGQAGSG